MSYGDKREWEWGEHLTQGSVDSIVGPEVVKLDVNGAIAHTTISLSRLGGTIDKIHTGRILPS